MTVLEHREKSTYAMKSPRAPVFGRHAVTVQTLLATATLATLSPALSTSLTTAALAALTALPTLLPTALSRALAALAALATLTTLATTLAAFEAFALAQIFTVAFSATLLEVALWCITGTTALLIHVVPLFEVIPCCTGSARRPAGEAHLRECGTRLV
jgi:hypothetical protein